MNGRIPVVFAIRAANVHLRPANSSVFPEPCVFVAAGCLPPPHPNKKHAVTVTTKRQRRIAMQFSSWQYLLADVGKFHQNRVSRLAVAAQVAPLNSPIARMLHATALVNGAGEYRDITLTAASPARYGANTLATVRAGKGIEPSGFSRNRQRRFNHKGISALRATCNRVAPMVIAEIATFGARGSNHSGVMVAVEPGGAFKPSGGSTICPNAMQFAGVVSGNCNW